MAGEAGSSSTSGRPGDPCDPGVQLEKLVTPDNRNWEMQIYQQQGANDQVHEVEDDLLELGLEDAEEEISKKHLTIAVYYSHKGFNPQILFSEMFKAWGVQNLVAIEKIGVHTFKLEFSREDEKKKVLEGGPWRHKGDALIINHYDGWSRPSEVRIEAIAMWVRFYDFPMPMLKEQFAR
jgi:hypothetical protein